MGTALADRLTEKGVDIDVVVRSPTPLDRLQRPWPSDLSCHYVRDLSKIDTVAEPLLCPTKSHGRPHQLKLNPLQVSSKINAWYWSTIVSCEARLSNGLRRWSGMPALPKSTSRSMHHRFHIHASMESTCRPKKNSSPHALKAASPSLSPRVSALGADSQLSRGR